MKKIKMKQRKKFSKTEITTGEQKAYFLMENIDTISFVTKMMLKKNAHMLTLRDDTLVEALVESLTRIGFELSYEPVKSLRMVSPYGFSVYFGKLLSFDKYSKIKVVCEGSSSQYRDDNRFTYLNRILNTIESIVRKHTGKAVDTRISRLDINRDFICMGLNDLVNVNSLPNEKRNMEPTRYFKYREDRSRVSGVRFMNSTSEVNFYDKGLESKGRDESYESFYKSIQKGRNEKIFRMEVKFKATAKNNRSYVVLRSALITGELKKIKNAIKEVIQLNFNEFWLSHEFKYSDNEVDQHLKRLMVTEDLVSTEHEAAENNIYKKDFNFTLNDCLQKPVTREDMIKSLTRAYLRVGIDPRDLNSGELAEISTAYRVKRRRTQLQFKELLNAQKRALMMVSSDINSDQDEIEERYQESLSLMCPDLVSKEVYRKYRTSDMFIR